MVNLIIKKVYNVEDGEKLKMCLIIFTGSAHFKLVIILITGTTNFPSFIKTQTGQIRSAWEWQHWIGTEKDINHCRFLIL